MVSGEKMKRVEELRRTLREKYSFSQYCTSCEVDALQTGKPENFLDTTVAVLIAGCVRMDALLFSDGENILWGYDVFVKDTPDSPEWIRYDTLNVDVSMEEAEMLFVLDRIVAVNDLSYTECCFEERKGIEAKREERTI